MRARRPAVLAGEDTARLRSLLAIGTARRWSWTSNTPFAGMTQAGSTGMFSAGTSRHPGGPDQSARRATGCQGARFGAGSTSVLGTQPPTPHSTTRWPDLSERETRDRGAIAYRMAAVRDQTGTTTSIAPLTEAQCQYRQNHRPPAIRTCAREPY